MINPVSVDDSSTGFGTVIAVNQQNGQQIAIGAPGYAGSVNNNATTGAVFLYSVGGTLEQSLYPVITGSDRFGTSIAMSGTTLAVGSPYSNDSGQFSGRVVIYSYTGLNWYQSKSFVPDSIEAFDEFGHTVALVLNPDDPPNLNRLVVGAPGYDGVSDQDLGAVLSYRYSHPVEFADSYVSINVLRTNLAPVIASQTINIDENPAYDTVIGTVTANDPDHDTIVSYQIIDGNTDSAFAINNQGQITVLSPSAINYDANPTFTLTVAATDDGDNPGPATGTGTVTITLNNTNSNPRVTNTNATVAETAQDGDEVVVVRWSDFDGDSISNFEIIPWNGTTINPFTVDANGIVRVADASLLTLGTTYDLQVRATDDGEPARTGVGLYEITVVGSSFYEYESLDSSSLNAPDLELGQTDVFQIIDSGYGIYIPLWRSANQQHTFNYAGTVYEQEFENQVTPLVVNSDYGTLTFDTPQTGRGQPRGDESDFKDAPNQATIAPYWSVFSDDVSQSDAVLYKFDDFDNNGNTDLIIEWSQVSYDYDLTGNGVTFQLILELDTGLVPGQIWFNLIDLDDGTGTDGAWYNEGARAAVGLKDSNPVTDRYVSVHTAWEYPGNNFVPNPEVQSGKAIRFFIPPPPNDAPTIEDATFTIAENSPNGTSVGTVVASDPNVRDTLSYSITSGNTGNAFAISSTGQITVLNPSALDYEATPQFQLTVQVRDDGTGNLTDTATVTIDLTDVFEPPFYVAKSAAFIDLNTLDLATDNQASLLSNASNADDLAEAIDLGSNVFRFGGQDYTGNDQLYVSSNGTISLGSSYSHYSNNNFASTNLPLIAPFWDDLRTDRGGPPDDQIYYRIFDYDNDGNDELIIQWNEARYFGSPFDNTNGITFQAILDLNTGTSPANILFNYHDFDDGTGSGQDDGGNALVAIKYGNGNPADSLIVHSSTSPNVSLFGEGKAILLEVLINDPPEIEDQTFEIGENISGGTMVGTVAFSDPDTGDTATLSLSNVPSSFPFDVNLQTGEITIKQGESLDFEQTTQYVFTMTVTDSEDESASAEITINVTNINEAPTSATLSVNTVGENLPVGTAVGTLSSFDPENSSVTFTLVSGDGDTNNNLFTVEGNELKTAAVINFEQLQVVSIRIRATDTENLHSEANLTLLVNDRNDAPTLSSETFSIAENPTTDDIIGTVNANDEDFGQSLSYQILSGNDNNDLRIDDDGNLIVVNSAAFDFEANANWTLAVEVSDSFTPTAKATATITVNVTDVNEAPSFEITQVVAELSEDADIESELKIADVVLVDDLLGVNTHWLTGIDAGLFELRNSTLFLRAGTELDFESNPVLDVTINLDDSHLTPQIDFQQSISVTVTDVNEGPALQVTQTVTELPEDADTTNRIKLADIAITDDALGTNSLSLSGDDSDLFEIDGTELFLVAGADLDFEVNPTLNVIVQVDDTSVGNTPDDTAPLSISVTDVNEPPTVTLQNSMTTLAENFDTTTRTKVADIVVADDALGTNTLSLTGADADLFEIEGAALFLKANASLDFEISPILNVTVQIDDSSIGNTPDEMAALSIQVTDVNEAPTLEVSQIVTELAEDADTSNTIKIADISVMDDSLGSNILSLTGADEDHFEIVGTELFLKAGVVLDFEQQTELQVIVQVDDAAIGNSHDAQQVLTISIIDVNENGPTTRIDITSSSLGYGIPGQDNAIGAGFILYSQQIVQQRFAGAIVANGAEHFLAVRFINNQWQYANNDVWVDFTPTTGDRLIAAIDFDSSQVEMLRGSSGSVNGINQGYLESDLMITANQWRDVFNEGEFSITGTYFTFE